MVLPRDFPGRASRMMLLRRYMKGVGTLGRQYILSRVRRRVSSISGWSKGGLDRHREQLRGLKIKREEKVGRTLYGTTLMSMHQQLIDLNQCLDPIMQPKHRKNN
jgi:hypothetical protein